MEEKTSGRTREADVNVGGWHPFGCQSEDGRNHRGESKRCVADENCSERAHQREMGSKQFGNGCGGPLAQKRRRPKVGWRTSQERSGGDGQGVQRKVGGRRACSSPEASAHFTSESEGIRIYSEVSGVHVVASGNCETSAYGKLSKANRGGVERAPRRLMLRHDA